MSLHAREFFDELCLPFHDAVVVGNTCYASPVPDAPLRLRIEFASTINAEVYGGLRAVVIHSDRGVIDAVALTFLDYGTFHRRDKAHNTPIARVTDGVRFRDRWRCEEVPIADCRTSAPRFRDLPPAVDESLTRHLLCRVTATSCTP
ncbi:hypothetical protein GCM10010400_38360 [Streptomyces aculeolatus]|uniref:hypothetical protein n=1 Tax=Streptomyces aculeolatus TaxID=270689 RepID=UPI001CED7A07|nr:hypothetical protein [Streptomyces aculeolatus]